MPTESGWNGAVPERENAMLSGLLVPQPSGIAHWYGVCRLHMYMCVRLIVYTLY